MLALTAMICLYFVCGELPTLGIYNTDTSREIDRLSRDKVSMPPSMKGILCIKFGLVKIKNTDFWAAYGETSLLGVLDFKQKLLTPSLARLAPVLS